MSRARTLHVRTSGQEGGERNKSELGHNSSVPKGRYRYQLQNVESLDEYTSARELSTIPIGLAHEYA